MDLRVFAKRQTWDAFLISIMLFAVIAYSGLTVFGMTTSKFGVSDEAEIAPNFEMISLNRTGIESDFTNETGWFELEEHRGKVIILDFMAHDCLACHGVQAHLEENMQTWNEMDSEYERYQLPPGLYLFMIVWLIFGFIGLLELFGFGSIANFAHLGGLLSGVMFAMIYKNLYRSM